MKFFDNLKGKKAPKLTREAQVLSKELESLDELNLHRTTETCSGIIKAVGNLSRMPESVTSQLTSIVMIIFTKLAVPGSSSDVLMEQIKDGLSPEIQELIFGAVRHERR